MSHVFKWSIHAYVHVHRRPHQANLTSPAVIDKSDWTLVSCILDCRYVSMVMSGALPISATYTNPASPRNGSGRQQEAPHCSDQC